MAKIPLRAKYFCLAGKNCVAVGVIGVGLGAGRNGLYELRKGGLAGVFRLVLELLMLLKMRCNRFMGYLSETDHHGRQDNLDNLI